MTRPKIDAVLLELKNANARIERLQSRLGQVEQDRDGLAAALAQLLPKADQPYSPCPFCASKHTGLVKGNQGFSVICLDCSAIGPRGTTETEAGRLWNRRVLAAVLGRSGSTNQ